MSSEALKGAGAGPRKRRGRLAVALSLSLLGLTAGVLAYHQVDNSVTEEDVLYISQYVENAHPHLAQDQRTFEDELGFILHVQRSVLAMALEKDGIPLNRGREPKDLYLVKSARCYDTSRVIEKILRYTGFTTRHVTLLATKPTYSPLQALVTPGVPSHAITEVLTSKGWLVVDSNRNWVSIDQDDTPYSIDMVLSDVAASRIRWKKAPPEDNYEAPFLYVYGLYSRHGRFYPPYNFIPDVNYQELMQNW